MVSKDELRKTKNEIEERLKAHKEIENKLYKELKKIDKLTVAAYNNNSDNVDDLQIEYDRALSRYYNSSNETEIMENFLESITDAILSYPDFK